MREVVERRCSRCGEMMGLTDTDDFSSDPDYPHIRQKWHCKRCKCFEVVHIECEESCL